MISWALLYIISEWVIRLVMLVVVTRRRRPSSAMAWLLVIFFLPWVGFVLYLLIGENRLPRYRVKQHARLLEELEAIGRRFKDHPNIVRPSLEPGLNATVALAEHLGYMPILGGNGVDLIPRSGDFIERLIADIDAARHHVHLLFYIYADDGIGKRVTEALVRASQRDVKCRMLVDSVGSRPMLKAMGAYMSERGVELREALPVGLFRRHMARIDMRNHRKLAVIDGNIAYTGSQNIVDESYGHKNLAWHDLMVRLTGPVVLQLQVVFLGDWYLETNQLLEGIDVLPEPSLSGTVSVQTLPSGPNYPIENYQRLVIAALHDARRHVVITTPYFVPDEAFMQAIETAALSGVEVDLIIPHKSDKILVDAASRAYYENLLDVGVRLHLYTKGLLHAKTMTVDGEIAVIGSGNFDIRSFAIDFEINLIFYGSHVAERLMAQQNQYIESSHRLDSEQWKRRPLIQSVFQNIAKLLSPLL